MAGLKLYDLERSGNCYKARLMLGLLGLSYERITVNLSAGEQHRPEFLAINPLHQVPVLDDNGTIIRDSQAILVYLGARFGEGRWYPAEPVGMAQVQQWLSYTAHEILTALAATRAIRLGIRQGDLAAAQESARRVLGQIEHALAGRDWLELGRPTIADVAAYPYVAMIPVGGVPLTPYPNITAWTERIATLPGHVPLPQIQPPA